MNWTFDHGVYRWRAPHGYYRVSYQGRRWLAAMNRTRGFPVSLGSFATLAEARAACVERENNAAGTVTKGGRVDVLVEPLTAETVDAREAWRELV